jgi:hypothetical protein
MGPKAPMISDAKELAMRLRRRGVAVIAIGGGNWGAASYGMTRRDCDAMRRFVDRLFELVESGQLEIPEELRG